MALSSKVVSFTKATSTGNQSVTGVGFQGKVAIFYTVGAGSNNSWIGSTIATIGFAAINSSNAYSDGNIAWSQQQSSDPTVSARRASDSAICFHRYDGVLRDEADFVSFDSDGFTVNWTTVSADTRIIYALILGGSSITDAKVVNFARITTTGNQTVTGAGFTPDSMLLLSTCNSAAFNTSNSSANISFGATDGTNQFLTALVDSNGQATSATAKGHRNNAIVGALDTAGTWTALASFSSFNSDGCVLNWSVNQGTAGRMCALFIKGANVVVKTRAKDSSVAPSIGHDIALTYEPSAVISNSVWGGTITGTGTNHGHFSFGASDGTNNAAFAMATIDGNAAQSVEGIQRIDRAIIKVTETSRTTTAAANATIGTYNNSFDYYWNSTDSTTSNMSYIIFGPRDVKDITNHIGNPNFETNTTGWTGGGSTLTRITTDSYAGTACLKAAISSTATVPYSMWAANGSTDPRRIPAASGDIIYMSAWVKAGNAGAVGQDVKLQIRGFDSSNSTAIGAAQTSSAVTVSSSWQQITFTSTAMPANTYGLQFLLRCELSGLNVGDEFLWDQVELRINQPLDTYVDGSQGTYHSWIGVTNDSKSVRSKIVNTKEFTSDGHVVNTFNKDITSDALVLDTITKEFTSDAILISVITKEFTSDAILFAENNSEFTSDAQVTSGTIENTKDFTSDAFIVVHLSTFHDEFDDGIDTGWTYSANVTESFDLLAFNPTAGTTSVETAIQTTSYYFDKAIFKLENIGNAHNFFGVKDDVSNNIIGFEIDTQVLGRLYFSVYDSVLADYHQYDYVSLSSQKWFKVYLDSANITWAYSNDGISWTDATTAPISETFDLGNAKLYAQFDKGVEPTWPVVSGLRIDSINTGERNFTADAYIIEVMQIEFTGDAVVTLQGTSEFTGNAIVQAATNSDFSSDAIVQDTLNKEFTASSIIVVTNNKDFTGDAEVVLGAAATNTKEFTANANVSAAVNTKLYVTSNSPSWSGSTLLYKGSWTQANFTKYLMSEDLDNIGTSTSRSLSETTTTNPNTAGMSMFVSPALSTNQTIAGMLDFVIGVSETSTAANMSLKIHAYVVAGDTNTLRGTLVSDWNEPITNEFPTTAMGYGVTGQIPCNTVNAQAGDYIVIEAGFYAANSTTTSYTGRIYCGATTNPVELTIGNSNVTTRAGWIGFTDNLQFTYTSRLKTFTADAILGQTPIKEFTANGIVKAEITKEITANAVVAATNQINEFTGSSILQHTPTKEVTSDAVITQVDTYEITSDAIVFATNVSEFTGSSLVQGEQQLDISSSAIVFDTLYSEIISTALVQDTLIADIDCDAILLDTIFSDIDADSLVLETIDVDVVSTAILQEEVQSEITSDGYVVIPVTINFTGSGTVFATEFNEFSADAELVGAPGTVIATQVIVSDIMGDVMVINDSFGTIPYVISDINFTAKVLKGGEE